MDISIVVEKVVEHFLMSLVPGIVGVLVGGGLGVIYALLLRQLLSARPGVRWLLALLPWRTVVMGLLVVVWTPFIVARLGLGPTAGGVMVGLSVLLLGSSVTGWMLVEHWHPAPLAVRLIGAGRTLMTGAVVLAVGAGFVGGGGIGFMVIQYFRLFKYGMAWTWIGAVVGLLLLLDLVFGVPQVIAAYVGVRQGTGEKAQHEET